VIAAGSDWTRAWRRCVLAIVAGAATIALGLAPGCAYSAGPIVRAGERRIHLPLFENRTWYRDLEIGLTRQVERELSSRPGISIVPRERADIVLAGAIVAFEQRVLSEDRLDQVRESSAIAVVRIDVKDARSGEVRRSFEVRDRAEFLASRGESLDSATKEAFFDLARRIADGLDGDFPRASAQARGEAPPAHPDGAQ
jgi:hypothetical protein